MRPLIRNQSIQVNVNQQPLLCEACIWAFRQPRAATIAPQYYNFHDAISQNVFDKLVGAWHAPRFREQLNCDDVKHYLSLHRLSHIFPSQETQCPQSLSSFISCSNASCGATRVGRGSQRMWSRFYVAGSIWWANWGNIGAECVAAWLAEWRILHQVWQRNSNPHSSLLPIRWHGAVPFLQGHRPKPLLLCRSEQAYRLDSNCKRTRVLIFAFRNYWVM